MELKTLTRLAAVLATLFGVLGTVLAVVAPSAGALEQSRVTIDKAGTTSIDYGPIIGDNPGAQADASTTISTDTCQTGGCDVIPLTIDTPAGLGPDDDYFVQIQLIWDTQEVNNVPVFGTYDVDDLDMWLQNDPVVPDAGANQDGFTYYSAGSHEPEQVTMYKPTGKWNILVVNASGVNTGYTLKFDVIVDRIPTGFFESLPPAFSGGAIPPPPTPTTTPPAPAYTPPAPPVVNIAPATPPKADTSFAVPDTKGRSLDDQLASPPVVNIRPAAAVRPEAPSGISIIFWMLALPLALLALAGAFLLRRQRALIQV